MAIISEMVKFRVANLNLHFEKLYRLLYIYGLLKKQVIN